MSRKKIARKRKMQKLNQTWAKGPKEVPAQKKI